MLPRVSQIGLQLFLARTHPRRVMLLRDAHTLVSEEHRDPLNQYATEEKLHSERVTEAVRMAL